MKLAFPPGHGGSSNRIAYAAITCYKHFDTGLCKPRKKKSYTQ